MCQKCRYAEKIQVNLYLSFTKPLTQVTLVNDRNDYQPTDIDK
jgi:hypothetical protein